MTFIPFVLNMNQFFIKKNDSRRELFHLSLLVYSYMHTNTQISEGR